VHYYTKAEFRSRGFLHLSTKYKESKDRKKVIPQYNNFHISASTDASDSDEGKFSMKQPDNLHLLYLLFLTVIKLKINVNSQEASFCTKMHTTHTHTYLFYGHLDFVWDYPGEPVPER